MILTGKLQSGAKVPPERELAQMFGFSRGSVREAVRELSALGILSARQGDGTYVSSLKSIDLFAPLDFVLLVDPRSLLDVIDLRLLLEPHVASIAAARIQPNDVATLQDALTQYERSVEGDPPDYELLLELDDTIHKILLRQAENPLIEAIVRSIDSLVRRGRELTVVMKSALLESANELRAVVDGVAAKDPARAHAAMTWHITCWAEHIRKEAEPRLRGG
jgi:GntR family transcriptional repressor for pyruvate dehydrogenase complex